ncbi:hypothetical protein H0H93_005513 [Arthromyces matolae]|nr:hypothetical protein H0H93_005513 [Arthromyces matolae]
MPLNIQLTPTWFNLAERQTEHCPLTQPRKLHPPPPSTDTPIPFAMEDVYATIRVIPVTPPSEPHQNLPRIELDHDVAHTWSAPTMDPFTAPNIKDSLQLQIPQPLQGSPYLSSPASPTSSTHTLSPGGLANFFSDITFADHDSEPLIDDTYHYNADQEVLQDQASLSTRERDAFSFSISPDFINSVYTPSQPIEEDLFGLVNFDASLNGSESSPSQQDFGAYAAPQPLAAPLNFFALSSPAPCSPSQLAGVDTLLTPPLSGGGLARRHSFVGHSRPNLIIPGGGESPSLLSPQGFTNTRQPRRYSHSHSNSESSISYMVPSDNTLSNSSSLSPDVILGENSTSLHRRHTSAGSGSQRIMGSDDSLRRSRSTSSVRSRSRSPYARPDVAPIDAYPTPNSDVHFSPSGSTRTPEYSAPPSPLPPSPRSFTSSGSDDPFRRYDDANGISYPMVQRDNIASDAVLEASARRRKKAATYKCDRCGQMLTSKDNLKSM